jgi:hypothetical protein
MASAARAFAAFCDALPELPDDLQGALAATLPGALREPPAATRAKLEAIAAAAGGLTLEAAGKLVAKVRAAGRGGGRRLGLGSVHRRVVPRPCPGSMRPGPSLSSQPALPPPRPPSRRLRCGTAAPRPRAAA